MSPVATPALARLFHDGIETGSAAAAVDLIDQVARPGATAWLDIPDAKVDDLKALDSVFGLHELALADAALGEVDRPRVSRYESHLFVTAQMVARDAAGHLRPTQLAAFVLPGILITVHASGSLDVDAVSARWRTHPERPGMAVALPLYVLLDELVTGHMRVLQELDERVDDMEDLVFDESAVAIRAVQRQLFQVRKDLVALRRAVVPMRDVLLAILRPGTDLVPPPLVAYFQDVYDGVLRVGEWSETLRELVTSVVETNLTVQSNRTNVIMKKVTSWAAIIAVPTAITGFYGQNVPYPGSGQPAGVLTSVLLIAVSSLVLYLVFRRRGWL